MLLRPIINKSAELFLGSRRLAEILHDIGPLSCLDIGARGGITEDILPLGCAAEVYGFEPDEAECTRLNRDLQYHDHPFALLRFLPTALGPRQEKRTLNIMRHAGSSSLLLPDPRFISRFQNRSDYFDIARTTTVETRPLDDVIAMHGIANTVYMKIDVEGFELEVLKGAKTLLASTLLAVRAEFALSSLRLGQADLGEISGFLKRFHFMPMGFLSLFDWRSQTRAVYPRKAGGAILYSRGQTIHGDVLFLRDPGSLDNQTEDGIKALLNLAFLALLYEYVDFAHDIIQQPSVRTYLHEHHAGSDIVATLGEVSRFLLTRRDRRTIKLWRKGLKKRVKSNISRSVTR